MEPAFSTEISCHAYMIPANAYYCARHRVFPTGGDVVWGSPSHRLKICPYPSPVDSPQPHFYSHPPKVNNSPSTK